MINDYNFRKLFNKNIRMTKPKFPGKPLIIDFEKIESENIGLEFDKGSNELLESLFADIRMLLKLNFENISNELASKPNTVFKIDSDIDTLSIRRQVSNLNQTCFYENGRIFVYSNFLNEVVFGIDNWLFDENLEAETLSFLFANYEISCNQLQRIFAVDNLSSFDFLDSLFLILKYSSDLENFFLIERQIDRICIHPKENLIDSLLIFKRTLFH